MYYEGGVRVCGDQCGFARFLVRFCSDFYFQLRYCGFTKPSGLRVFRNFRVFSMWFAVFLCYYVRYLYVFLRDFAVFVPPLRPPLKDLMLIYIFLSIKLRKGRKFIINTAKHCLFRLIKLNPVQHLFLTLGGKLFLSSYTLNVGAFLSV